MPVAKLEPPPRSYINAYWSNWQAVLYKRRPNPELKGRCYGCKVNGVLAVDLKHRGETLWETLLCDDCAKG